jgi:hypothetical protein
MRAVQSGDCRVFLSFVVPGDPETYRPMRAAPFRRRAVFAN